MSAALSVLKAANANLRMTTFGKLGLNDEFHIEYSQTIYRKIDDTHARVVHGPHLPKAEQMMTLSIRGDVRVQTDIN